MVVVFGVCFRVGGEGGWFSWDRAFVSGAIILSVTSNLIFPRTPGKEGS